MLEFGQNEVDWANIAHVTVTGSTVTVTDTDNVTLTVGVYENAAKATKIKDMIEAGREAVTIGGVTIVIAFNENPCTTNGCSFYIYAKAFANNDTVKFRTSDHSVTNSSRILGEIHLNDMDAATRWFLSLEKKRNPERFVKVAKTIISEIADIPSVQLQNGDVVTATRTTKKGTTRYSVTRTTTLEIVTDERI